jgi:hypothetical protein
MAAPDIQQSTTGASRAAIDPSWCPTVGTRHPGRPLAGHTWRAAPVRTWSLTVPRKDLLPLLVSFPVAFAIHEAEEVIGVRWFSVEARTRLSTRLAQVGAPHAFARSVGELSPPHMAVAVTTVAAGVAAATLAAVGARKDLRPWQSAFTVFAWHAGTHLGQAVILRAYVPGSVTAIAVVAPYSAVAIRHLRSQGLWDPGTIRLSLLTGVPAAAFLAVAGHVLGSAVARVVHP